jgi:hypothetical protein
MSIRTRASVAILFATSTAALLAAPSLAVSSHAGGGITPLHDYNNDGYDDLAIGIPGATVNGISNAGAIEVIYGSPNGLRSTGSQVWNLASPGVPGVPSRDDRLGFAVATGDFNADGYDDLVAGAPYADIRLANGTTYADTGMMLVLFGSATGLIAAHAQWMSDGSADADAHAGWALASCDILGSGGNPDHHDDIVVGSPGTGWMNVVAGVGLHSGNRSSVGQSTFFGKSGAVGAAVGCGHLTGRSLADAVFGAPNASGGPLQTAVPGSGAVLVWRGDGTTALTVEQDNFGGNPREKGDHFGAAVAVGDVNGDFHDDLLVGAPDEDLSGTTDNGALSEFFGDGAGSFSSASLVLTEDTPRVPGNRQNGDHFGASIALADLNLDLKAALDMAIGMPGKPVGGHPGAGAIDVLYNAGDGSPASSGNQLFSQDSTGVVGSSAGGDRFGTHVTIGWYRAIDGWCVAVGVPGDGVSGNAHAGAVAVLYNAGGGLGSRRNQLWTRNSNGIAGSAHAGDHFGRGL